MVLITKQNKRKVYEYLLREGVIVIKRDPGLPEHKDTGVPNLHAMMLLKSLHSKNYVELVFCWHHFYYFVKTEGIKYLRGVLGIPDEVVPLTYKKTKKNYTGVEEREEGEDRPRGRGRGRGRGGRGGRGFGRGFGRGPRRGEEGAEGEARPEGGEEAPVNNEAAE